MPGTRRRKRCDAAPGLPTLPSPEQWASLMEGLQFEPEQGRISLEGLRVILMHAEALGALRQEIIDSVGAETARGLFTRLGYVAGSQDAQAALKIKASGRDFIGVGASFHALQGHVRVEPIRVEVDSTVGYCYGEMLWKNSVEADVHIAANGIGSEPACWMEVGHASGYLSTLMGKRITVREVECRAMGHECCRAIAKPVEEWDDPEEDLRHLQPRARLRQVPDIQDSRRTAATTIVPRRAARPDREYLEPDRIVGASAAFNSTMHKILRVASTRATVLLLGESGTGKSRFAHQIHVHSPRHDRVFVEVNCAAIPEQLIESELFGAERGAYSGATESRQGRFEIANGGTIFFDEVSTLSLTAQGKLLRVLQTGEMEHLGSTRTIRVDVRVIAATNENLQKAVREGRFRSDLYYRLNVFPVMVPPLRDRCDDLPILLEHFLDKFCHIHGRSLRGITPRALQTIMSYGWPGNIREFENTIERGIILAEEGESLDVRHLFSVEGSDYADPLTQISEFGTLAGSARTTPAVGAIEPTGTAGPDAGTEPSDLDAWADAMVQRGGATLASVEEALVRAAVRHARGNVSRSAALLRISRTQMDYRVKKMALRKLKPTH